MADLMISLALGGLLFWFVKWLVLREPFRYPLSIVQRYRLGKTLTKLSNVLEAVEQTRYSQSIGMRGSIEGLPVSQQAQAVDDLYSSMAELGAFDPEVVTYVTLGHIRVSLSLDRQTRAEAQARMLDLLNDEGLAVPASMFA